MVEFKRLLIRSCKALKRIFEVVKEALLQLAGKISKAVQMICNEYRNMPPKERYKAVRRLDKCGFTEKEINLMIGGAYHCRNNC